MAKAIINTARKKANIFTVNLPNILADVYMKDYMLMKIRTYLTKTVCVVML